MESRRLGLDQAELELLKHIPLDHPMSINEFRKTRMENASWHTIQKALTLIQKVQADLLQKNIVLEVKKDGNRYVIDTRRINLLSLPVEERARYVRQKYFPQPESEDLLLIELYRRNVIKRENAVHLKEDETTKKLLNEEKICRAGQKIYLTEEGIAIAKGLVRLYPELAPF